MKFGKVYFAPANISPACNGISEYVPRVIRFRFQHRFTRFQGEFISLLLLNDFEE